VEPDSAIEAVTRIDRHNKVQGRGAVCWRMPRLSASPRKRPPVQTHQETSLWAKAVLRIALPTGTAGAYCTLRTVFPKAISGLRKPIAIHAAISFNINLPEWPP
jgi:hypothetical protein